MQNASTSGAATTALSQSAIAEGLLPSSMHMTGSPEPPPLPDDVLPPMPPLPAEAPPGGFSMPPQPVSITAPKTKLARIVRPVVAVTFIAANLRARIFERKCRHETLVRRLKITRHVARNGWRW